MIRHAAATGCWLTCSIVCRGRSDGPGRQGGGRAQRPRGDCVSEQLGLELRRLREERGLTVEELAEKSGISATTVRAVERGTREARGDTVAQLAKPLGPTFEGVWRRP